MKTIHVGLTGLSRAGKTVFLTSAIHNFIEHTGRELSEFEYSGWQYVGRPVQLPDRVAPFRYRDHLRAFRENPPRWPEPTVDVTEYRLHLQFTHTDCRRRREAKVVFVDYPGERLIDVPLLEMRYEDWSDETLPRLTCPHETLREPARDFLACVQRMQPDQRGGISDNTWQMAQRAFGECCVRSRQAGQPIAPVVPVLLNERTSSAVCAPFFPLDSDTRNRLPQLHKRLKQEYAHYLSKSVTPFLKRIAACSHQIVLVDVLGVLRAGFEKYNEVREQMQRVLGCYRTINSGRFRWLWTMLGSPRINKVSFCATKADQATRDYRENLTSLLRDLFVRAEQDLKYDRRILGTIAYTPVAAHRCTNDVDTDHEGKPIVALQGNLTEGGKEDGLYFPGRVPQQWPENRDQWRSFQFPDFLPRKLPDIATGKPLPHLNMDRLLFSIVEDLLK